MLPFIIVKVHNKVPHLKAQWSGFWQSQKEKVQGLIPGPSSLRLILHLKLLCFNLKAPPDH